MTDRTDRIVEIRARRDAVTPGGWTAERKTHGWHVGPQPEGVCSIHDNTDGSHYEERKANATFIANAPTDIDYLLDENKRLREAVGEKSAAIQRAYQEGWYARVHSDEKWQGKRTMGYSYLHSYARQAAAASPQEGK